MKRLTLVTGLVGCLVLGLVGGTRAQVPGADELVREVEGQRLAQTGMKFLSVSVSPRAAAMANAVTAQEDVSALAGFYNPASMSRFDESIELAFGQVQWLGTITHNYAGGVYQPADGRFGVVGLSVRSVDYGEFKQNITFNNEQGYLNVGTYSPSGTSIGLTYARAISSAFSVGGDVKYVRQSLGTAVTSYENESASTTTYEKGTLAYDFGVLYRTGFESLKFAATVRNFATEVTYVEQNFELPLTFQVGLSMDMIDLTALNQDRHGLLLSVDARRPRDYAEQIRVGAEYSFMDVLSLRAGYIRPHDERGFSFGAGLETELSNVDLKANYGYTPYGRFGGVNRLGLTFGL